MVTFEQSQKQELHDLLKEAEKFHGHLGPFLVLGVRMGLIAVRELGAKGKDEKLRVTVMVKHFVPFSCVIDGIQVATKCTIGNKKLSLMNSPGIAAKFKLQNREQLVVTVNPVSLNKLKNRLLAENAPPQEVRKLAELVASMPEEELFIIGRK